MLNSPSNPTGSLYSKQELIALGEILKKHEQVYVLSDDIYEKIVYDDHKFHTFAEVCPDLKDRVYLTTKASLVILQFKGLIDVKNSL